MPESAPPCGHSPFDCPYPRCLYERPAGRPVTERGLLARELLFLRIPLPEIRFLTGLSRVWLWQLRSKPRVN
jgi:hypothetical protein